MASRGSRRPTSSKDKNAGVIKPFVAPELSLEDWPSIDVLKEDVLERCQSVFNSFDSANLGTIASVELGSFLRALGFQPSTKLVNKLNAAKSQDDRIHLKGALEIVALLKGDTTTPEAIIEAFKVFDPDQRGYVTISQCREILGSLGNDPLTPQRVEQFIAYADTQDTGHIEYAPLVHRLLAEASMPAPDPNELKKKKKK